MHFTNNFQRAEAAVMLLATLLAYQHFHFGWWFMVAFWLVFDISMLGYAAGNRIGAWCYNLAHSFITPGVLIGISILTDERLLLQIALVELVHITLDRVLGYGLKSTDGFQHTHLGVIGKHKHAN